MTSARLAVEIDEGLVRGLLREQHPDLASLSLRQVALGWDNEIWRLGDELVVRLPRSVGAGQLMERELMWLPELEGRLPLPIPTPVRRGEPSVAYPSRWAVVRWVGGESAEKAVIEGGERNAATLANFLRALHREGPVDAPAGYTLADKAEEFHRTTESVRWRLKGPGRLREMFEVAVAAPRWDGPALWVHADLHPANVTVVDGNLAGVIDFGMLCVGDPAVDLAAAWMLLPGDTSTFFSTYGQVDFATMQRSRGWAVVFGILLLGIGQAWERGLVGGQAHWATHGEATLLRLLNARPPHTDRIG